MHGVNVFYLKAAVAKALKMSALTLGLYMERMAAPDRAVEFRAGTDSSCLQ